MREVANRGIMSNKITFQVKLSEKIDINQIKSKLVSLEKKGLSVEIIHDEDDLLSARIGYPNKLKELEKKIMDIQRKRSKATDEILLTTYDDLIKSLKADIGVLDGGMEIYIVKDEPIKILKNLKQGKSVDVDIFKHYLDIYIKEIISNLFGNYQKSVSVYYE